MTEAKAFQEVVSKEPVVQVGGRDLINTCVQSQLMNVQNTTAVNLLIEKGISRQLAQRVQTCQHVAGCLALFSANWRCITSDRWVLNTIQGYQLEYTSTPTQTHPHGRCGILRGAEFLRGGTVINSLRYIIYMQHAQQ